MNFFFPGNQKSFLIDVSAACHYIDPAQLWVPGASVLWGAGYTFPNRDVEGFSFVFFANWVSAWLELHPWEKQQLTTLFFNWLVSVEQRGPDPCSPSLEISAAFQHVAHLK